MISIFLPFAKIDRSVENFKPRNNCASHLFEKATTYNGITSAGLNKLKPHFKSKIRKHSSFYPKPAIKRYVKLHLKPSIIKSHTDARGVT